MPSLAPSPIGRRKLLAWWCSAGHRNEGVDRICSTCSHSRVERHAQVHSSERAVFFRHPETGQIIRPPRADQPMHENYAKQGFVREEILNMSAHEKETGSIWEPGAYFSGNEPIPEDARPAPKAPKELINSIIDDLRAAHQSGPWTMEQPLNEGPREE